MRKMILRLSCGTGMNSDEAYLVTEEDYLAWKNQALDNNMDDEAWIAAVQFAESYGIYPECDRPEDSDPDEDDQYGSGEYSENIEGWWEEYDPEKHDGLMIGYQKEWTWQEL